MAKDGVEALKQVPLFEGLSKQELRHILRESQEETFSEGKVIVTEGSPSGRFYMILEGYATVSVSGRTRRKLGPGDFFGEMSLIDRGPRSATVKTTSRVKALSIASWNFLALLEENWPMAKKVIAELVKRVRALDRAAND